MQGVLMKKGQLKIQVQENCRFSVPRFSRGQLKIQDMAFMLMAVVILFILAGLFFASVKYREMYKTSNQLEKEKALSTVAKIADTAEFSCGEPLCIDLDKLMVMKDRQAYSGFFPVTSLSVVKVFPKDVQVECTIANYPNCTSIKVYDKHVGNEESISAFVSLCRQEQDSGGYLYRKCELGKVIAGSEIKQAGVSK